MKNLHHSIRRIVVDRARIAKASEQFNRFCGLSKVGKTATGEEHYLKGKFKKLKKTCPVKFPVNGGGWLVNGANDGATGTGQLLHQVDHTLGHG